MILLKQKKVKNKKPDELKLSGLMIAYFKLQFTNITSIHIFKLVPLSKTVLA